MKQGSPTPEPMLTRPKLLKQSKPYYDAYQHLAKSRTLGSGGEFYIPMTEFQAYFAMLGLRSNDAKFRFIRVIQRVDEKVLVLRQEKRDAELKKAK